MSNVVIVDEKFTLFHQYLRYSHKWCTVVFSIPGAINEPNTILLAWLLPEIAYLSMQTTSRINSMLKYANSVENGASNVGLGS